MEILHFGINAENAAEAEKTALTLKALFGFEADSGNSSIFTAERRLELMKAKGPGTHGHICVGTHDIQRDMEELKIKGALFDEASAKYKNGELASIYLKDEIAGFAVHLMRY